ncbi:MAG: AgmX/PglI C-terminal domain-containing protein [Deltaproteobacteria bacterium]|nr:AgmX/PglI C-terminal domain-containing protein [Deltaproteobacteria bacterium]
MDNQVPTIRIAVYQGDKLLREEVFNQKTIRIGKAGQAHLRLDDENVSRQHAVIEVMESGDVRITDLESTNGTLLNGQRTTQAVLRSGDELVMGEMRLEVFLEGTVGEKKATDAFYSPSAVKDDSDLTSKSALEIAVLWNGEVVNVKHFRKGTKVQAGDQVGCQVFLPSEFLGHDRMDLAIPDGRNFLLDVSGPKVTGDVLIQGKVIKVEDLERRGKLTDGKYLKMDPGTKARLGFGPFTLMVGLEHLPKPIKTPLAKRINVQDHVYTAVSVILHLLFLIMIMLIPEEQLRATRDPYESRSQAFKMIQVAELEKMAELEQQRKAREEANKKKSEEKFATEDRTSSDKSKMKIKKMDELVSKLTPEELKKRNQEIADRALTRVLNQQDDLLSQVLGAGGDPNMAGTGPRVIGSTGPGSMVSGLDPFGGTLGGGTGGFRGTPGMFGGSEFGPADLKGITGLDKGGEGVATKLKFKRGQGRPVVYSAPYSVSGELDKATVRRYIQSKMNQIRWCYQQEVQRNPNLAGQVVYKWVITPTGKVIGVKVADSSLHSPAVEKCIASRIATWRFPSPRGGGTVKVKYPFIFRVTK